MKNKIFARINSYRKLYKLIIAVIAITVVVIAFADEYEKITYLSRYGLWHILALLALMGTYLFVFSYQMLLALRSCSNVRLRFMPWFKYFIIGRFVNKIASQSGIIYRAVFLKRDYGITYAQFAGAFSFLSWLNLVFYFGLAGILILIYDPHLKFNGVNAASCVFCFFGITMIAPVILKMFFRLKPPLTPFFARVYNLVINILNSFSKACKNKLLVGFTTLLALLVFCIVLLQFHVMLSVFDTDLNVAQISLFFVLLKLSSILIITPANIGIREIAFGILAASSGLSMSEGIMLSAILRIIGYCVVLPLGLIYGGLELWRSNV